MAFTSRWQDRNLSKLELVVAILLISLFIGDFSLKALRLFALSEQSYVTMTVNNMTTAIKYKVLVAAAQNRLQQLGDPEKINPMTLMYSSPKPISGEKQDLESIADNPSESTVSNYAGELYDPDIDDIEPGSWYYDMKDNLLIYVVKNTELFYSQLDGPARIRFAVRIEYDDVNHNDTFEPGIDRFLNVNITSVDEYKWNL